jgi:hypothetical protein
MSFHTLPSEILAHILAFIALDLGARCREGTMDGETPGDVPYISISFVLHVPDVVQARGTCSTITVQDHRHMGNGFPASSVEDFQMSS